MDFPSLLRVSINHPIILQISSTSPLAKLLYLEYRSSFLVRGTGTDNHSYLIRDQLTVSSCTLRPYRILKVIWQRWSWSDMRSRFLSHFICNLHTYSCTFDVLQSLSTSHNVRIFSRFNIMVHAKKLAASSIHFPTFFRWRERAKCFEMTPHCRSEDTGYYGTAPMARYCRCSTRRGRQQNGRTTHRWIAKCKHKMRLIVQPKPK